MTAATAMIPTASQIASSKCHLERREDWRYYWAEGVRYIAMPSGKSGRIYRVRADGAGCGCDAYQKWGYSTCSHMLSAREAAHHDALNEWLGDQADALLEEYDDLNFGHCGMCSAPRSLTAVMSGTPCPCYAARRKMTYAECTHRRLTDTMGREVRRVTSDWEHPKGDNGHYRPMFDKSYRVASEEWIAGLIKWESGDKPDSAGSIGCRYYWEWYGAPPDADESTYREREWTPEEATHYQLYETTSEGTPISPIFDNLDALCEWAADNATTFGSSKTTKERWRAMLDDGYVYHQEGNVIFS